MSGAESPKAHHSIQIAHQVPEIYFDHPVKRDTGLTKTFFNSLEAKNCRDPHTCRIENVENYQFQPNNVVAFHHSRPLEALSQAFQKLLDLLVLHGPQCLRVETKLLVLSADPVWTNPRRDLTSAIHSVLYAGSPSTCIFLLEKMEAETNANRKSSRSGQDRPIQLQKRIR